MRICLVFDSTIYIILYRARYVCNRGFNMVGHYDGEAKQYMLKILGFFCTHIHFFSVFALHAFGISDSGAKYMTFTCYFKDLA